jgi:hypothetical protein
MMELRVIDVEASNVDAMMLFRNVCTANIPFLAPSCKCQEKPNHKPIMNFSIRNRA